MARNRVYDDDDDEVPSIQKKGRSDGGLGVVIPYRNGMALAAYYCGVFGLISCFMCPLFGVVPIILGILGLKKAKQDPEASGTAHAWIGIVLGAVEVLWFVVIVGFFVVIAIKEHK